jgi:hypothetical protein
MARQQRAQHFLGDFEADAAVKGGFGSWQGTVRLGTGTPPCPNLGLQDGSKRHDLRTKPKGSKAGAGALRVLSQSTAPQVVTAGLAA